MPTVTMNGGIMKKIIPLLTFIMFLTISNIYAQELVSMDSIKTNDADGMSTWAQAPSVNVVGIVVTTSELGNGTAGPGTIQDGKTGIAIYGQFFAKEGGLKMGDSVIVKDVQVTAYFGLTELKYNSGSSVEIISSGHEVNPAVITIPEVSTGWNGFEKYESMLVQINNVTFIDTADTFTLNRTSGSGNKYGKYNFINGTDTLTFYFSNNYNSIIGKPIPKVPVNVVGILSQSCSNSPYNTGYEILPIDSSSVQTITAVESRTNTVNTFKLLQNYPNPFNPSTVISFELPKSQQVELSVYDLMGRKVQTLYNRIAPAGITNVNFKAVNLASGVYIYSLKTANSVMSKKLMLLK